MPKNKTTADLIVQHAQLHLEIKAATVAKSKPVDLIATPVNKVTPQITHSSLLTSVASTELSRILGSKSNNLFQKQKTAIASIITRFAGVSFFALAGLLISLAAWQLVDFSLSTSAEQAAFLARDAHDYAAQQAFYAGHVATINSNTTTGVNHAAAQSTELSQLLRGLGILLMLGGLAWWQSRCGCVDSNSIKFTIRRIK